MDDSFKETISTYNKIAQQYRFLRNKSILKNEINKFLNIVQGSLVLDVGCGPGRDVAVMKKKGWEVYGIDMAENALKLACSDVGENIFSQMDLRKMGFRSSTFNGIWCCAVLSHLRKCELSSALIEFNRVLKNDGVVFLAVKKGVREGMQREEEFDMQPRRYISRYSEEEVCFAARKSGFNVVEQYPYNEMLENSGNKRNIDFVFSFLLKVNN